MAETPTYTFDTRRCWSPDECCAYYDISRSTLYKLIRQGKLEYFEAAGRRRIKPEARRKFEKGGE